MTEERRPEEGDGLFRDLHPERPPAELRTRALTAAAEALERESNIWTRLWSSRPVRLAWAAAVVLLIGGHLAVAPLTRTAVGPGTRDTGFLMAALDSELQEIVNLPHIDQAALSGLP